MGSMSSPLVLPNALAGVDTTHMVKQGLRTGLKPLNEKNRNFSIKNYDVSKLLAQMNLPDLSMINKPQESKSIEANSEEIEEPEIEVRKTFAPANVSVYADATRYYTETQQNIGDETHSVTEPEIDQCWENICSFFASFLSEAELSEEVFDDLNNPFWRIILAEVGLPLNKTLAEDHLDGQFLMKMDEFSNSADCEQFIEYIKVLYNSWSEWDQLISHLMDASTEENENILKGLENVLAQHWIYHVLPHTMDPSGFNNPENTLWQQFAVTFDLPKDILIEEWDISLEDFKSLAATLNSEEGQEKLVLLGNIAATQGRKAKLTLEIQQESTSENIKVQQSIEEERDALSTVNSTLDTVMQQASAEVEMFESLKETLEQVNEAAPDIVEQLGGLIDQQNQVNEEYEKVHGSFISSLRELTQSLNSDKEIQNRIESDTDDLSSTVNDFINAMKDKQTRLQEQSISRKQQIEEISETISNLNTTTNSLIKGRENISTKYEEFATKINDIITTSNEGFTEILQQSIEGNDRRREQMEELKEAMKETNVYFRATNLKYEEESTKTVDSLIKEFDNAVKFQHERIKDESNAIKERSNIMMESFSTIQKELDTLNNTFKENRRNFEEGYANSSKKVNEILTYINDTEKTMTNVKLEEMDNLKTMCNDYVEAINASIEDIRKMQSTENKCILNKKFVQYMHQYANMFNDEIERIKENSNMAQISSFISKGYNTLYSILKSGTVISDAEMSWLERQNKLIKHWRTKIEATSPLRSIITEEFDEMDRRISEAEEALNAVQHENTTKEVSDEESPISCVSEYPEEEDGDDNDNNNNKGPENISYFSKEQEQRIAEAIIHFTIELQGITRNADIDGYISKINEWRESNKDLNGISRVNINTPILRYMLVDGVIPSSNPFHKPKKVLSDTESTMEMSDEVACSKLLTKGASIYWKIEGDRQKQTIYTCPIWTCNFITNEKYTLNLHMQSHEEYDEDDEAAIKQEVSVFWKAMISRANDEQYLTIGQLLRTKWLGGIKHYAMVDGKQCNEELTILSLFKGRKDEDKGLKIRYLRNTERIERARSINKTLGHITSSNEISFDKDVLASSTVMSALMEPGTLIDDDVLERIDKAEDSINRRMFLEKYVCKLTRAESKDQIQAIIQDLKKEKLIFPQKGYDTEINLVELMVRMNRFPEPGLMKCTEEGCPFCCDATKTLQKHLKEVHGKKNNELHYNPELQFDTYIKYILHAKKISWTTEDGTTTKITFCPCAGCNYIGANAASLKSHMTNTHHLIKNVVGAEKKLGIFWSALIHWAKGKQSIPSIAKLYRKRSGAMCTEESMGHICGCIVENAKAISHHRSSNHKEVRSKGSKLKYEKVTVKATIDQQEIKTGITLPERIQGDGRTPPNNDTPVQNNTLNSAINTNVQNTRNDQTETNRTTHSNRREVNETTIPKFSEAIPEETQQERTKRIRKGKRWFLKYSNQLEASFPKMIKSRKKKIKPHVVNFWKTYAWPLINKFAPRSEDIEEWQAFEGAIAKVTYKLIGIVQKVLLVNKKGNRLPEESKAERVARKFRVLRNVTSNAGVVLTDMYETLNDETISEEVRTNMLSKHIDELREVLGNTDQEKITELFGIREIELDNVMALLGEGIEHLESKLNWITATINQQETEALGGNTSMETALVREIYDTDPGKCIKWYIDKKETKECPIDTDVIEEKFTEKWGQSQEFTLATGEDAEFLVERVVNAEMNDVIIKKMKDPKTFSKVMKTRSPLSASGIDGISYPLITMGGDFAAYTMARISQMMMKTKRSVSLWKDTKSILIYKKGDAKEFSNWRPISITSCFWRIWACALANSFQDLQDQISFLSNSQKGFIRGVNGCFEHSAIINELIYDAQRNRKDIFVMALDLKDAFGSVSHKALFDTMRKMGFSEDVIHPLKDAYEDSQTIVYKSSTKTNPITIRKGVKQGCPLSPILFNMALNPLLEELNNKHLEEGYSFKEGYNVVQAYADDLILLSDNKANLIKLIHTVERFMSYMKISINPSKCIKLGYVQDGNRRTFDASEIYTYATKLFQRIVFKTQLRISEHNWVCRRSRSSKQHHKRSIKQSNALRRSESQH